MSTMSTIEDYSCINCSTYEKKLKASREWIKFYQQKLENKEKFLHIAVDYEREKQHNVELQLAYDQRSRDSSYIREQMTHLLLEIEPLKGKLSRTEEELRDEKQKRERAENQETGLLFTVEQQKHQLKMLREKADSNLVEILERKLTTARSDIKRLKLTIEDKTCEIDELRKYQADRRLHYERVNKRALWALTLAKDFAELIPKDVLSEMDLNDTFTRLNNVYDVTEKSAFTQYESFYKKEERRLKKSLVEMAALPSLEEWLDDFDKGSQVEEEEEEVLMSDGDSSQWFCNNKRNISKEGKKLQMLLQDDIKMEKGSTSLASPHSSTERDKRLVKLHGIKNEPTQSPSLSTNAKLVLSPASLDGIRGGGAVGCNVSQTSSSSLSLKEKSHFHNTGSNLHLKTNSGIREKKEKSLFDSDNEDPLPKVCSTKVLENKNYTLVSEATIPRQRTSVSEAINPRPAIIPRQKMSVSEALHPRQRRKSARNNNKRRSEGNEEMSLATESTIFNTTTPCVNGKGQFVSSNENVPKKKKLPIQQTDDNIISAILNDMKPKVKLDCLDQSFSLPEPEFASVLEGFDVDLSDFSDSDDKSYEDGKQHHLRKDTLLPDVDQVTTAKPKILLSQSSEGFPTLDIDVEVSNNMLKESCISDLKEPKVDKVSERKAEVKVQEIVRKEFCSSQGEETLGVRMKEGKDGNAKNRGVNAIAEKRTGSNATVSKSHVSKDLAENRDNSLADVLNNGSKNPKLQSLKKQKGVVRESCETEELKLENRMNQESKNGVRLLGENLEQANSKEVERVNEHVFAKGLELEKDDSDDIFGVISDTDDDDDDEEILTSLLQKKPSDSKFNTLHSQSSEHSKVDGQNQKIINSRENESLNSGRKDLTCGDGRTDELGHKECLKTTSVMMEKEKKEVSDNCVMSEKRNSHSTKRLIKTTPYSMDPLRNPEVKLPQDMNRESNIGEEKGADTNAVYGEHTTEPKLKKDIQVEKQKQFQDGRKIALDEFEKDIVHNNHKSTNELSVENVLQAHPSNFPADVNEMKSKVLIAEEESHSGRRKAEREQQNHKSKMLKEYSSETEEEDKISKINRIKAEYQKVLHFNRLSVEKRTVSTVVLESKDQKNVGGANILVEDTHQPEVGQPNHKQSVPITVNDSATCHGTEATPLSDVGNEKSSSCNMIENEGGSEKSSSWNVIKNERDSMDIDDIFGIISDSDDDDEIILTPNESELNNALTSSEVEISSGPLVTEEGGIIEGKNKESMVLDNIKGCSDKVVDHENAVQQVTLKANSEAVKCSSDTKDHDLSNKTAESTDTATSPCRDTNGKNQFSEGNASNGKIDTHIGSELLVSPPHDENSCDIKTMNVEGIIGIMTRSRERIRKLSETSVSAMQLLDSQDVTDTENSKQKSEVLTRSRNRSSSRIAARLGMNEANQTTPSNATYSKELETKKCKSISVKEDANCTNCSAVFSHGSKNCEDVMRRRRRSSSRLAAVEKKRKAFQVDMEELFQSKNKSTDLGDCEIQNLLVHQEESKGRDLLKENQPSSENNLQPKAGEEKRNFESSENNLQPKEGEQKRNFESSENNLQLKAGEQKRNVESSENDLQPKAVEQKRNFESIENDLQPKEGEQKRNFESREAVKEMQTQQLTVKDTKPPQRASVSRVSFKWGQKQQVISNNRIKFLKKGSIFTCFRDILGSRHHTLFSIENRAWRSKNCAKYRECGIELVPQLANTSSVSRVKRCNVNRNKEEEHNKQIALNRSKEEGYINIKHASSVRDGKEEIPLLRRKVQTSKSAEESCGENGSLSCTKQTTSIQQKILETTINTRGKKRSSDELSSTLNTTGTSNSNLMLDGRDFISSQKRRKREQCVRGRSTQKLLFGTESSVVEEESSDCEKRRSTRCKKKKVERKRVNTRSSTANQGKKVNYRVSTSEEESDDDDGVTNYKSRNNKTNLELRNTNQTSVKHQNTKRVVRTLTSEGKKKETKTILHSESESDTDHDSLSDSNRWKRKINVKRETLIITSESDDSECEYSPQKVLNKKENNGNTSIESSKGKMSSKKFKSQLVKKAVRLHKKSYYPVQNHPRYQHVKSINESAEVEESIKPLPKESVKGSSIRNSECSSKGELHTVSQEPGVCKFMSLQKDALEIASRLSMNHRCTQENKRTTIFLDRALQLSSKHTRKNSESKFNSFASKGKTLEKTPEKNSAVKEKESGVLPEVDSIHSGNKEEESEAEMFSENLGNNCMMQTNNRSLKRDLSNSSDEEDPMYICEGSAESDIGIKEGNHTEGDGCAVANKQPVQDSTSSNYVAHPGIVSSLLQLKSLVRPKTMAKPSKPIKVTPTVRVPASSDFVNKLFLQSESSKKRILKNEPVEQQQVVGNAGAAATNLSSSETGFSVTKNSRNLVVNDRQSSSNVSQNPLSSSMHLVNKEAACVTGDAKRLNFYITGADHSKECSVERAPAEKLQASKNTKVSSEQIVPNKTSHEQQFEDEQPIYPSLMSDDSQSDVDLFCTRKSVVRIPPSRVLTGEGRQLSDSNYCEMLEELSTSRISSQHWHRYINRLCATYMAAPQLNSVARSFLKTILRADPCEQKEITEGLNPSLFKLFQAMAVLERRSLLPTAYLKNIIMTSIHKLIVTRRLLRPKHLASLASWFTASILIPDEEGRLQFEWLRCFLIDLIFHYPGAVHLAILSALQTNRRILVRPHSDRKVTCLEKLIHWISLHGDWIGSDSVRTRLVEVMSKIMDSEDEPLKNPIFLSRGLLDELADCSDETFSRNIILSIVILARWQETSWIQDELIPEVKSIATIHSKGNKDSETLSQLSSKFNVLMDYLMAEMKKRPPVRDE